MGAIAITTGVPLTGLVWGVVLALALLGAIWLYLEKTIKR